MKLFYYTKLLVSNNKNTDVIFDGILIEAGDNVTRNNAEYFLKQKIEQSNGFCLLKINSSDTDNLYYIICELIKIAKSGLIFGVIIHANKGLIKEYLESNYIKSLSEVGISVIASNPSSLFETVLCLKSGASIISFDKIDEEKIRNTKKIFEQYPDLIYGTYSQIQEGEEMVSNQILGHGVMIDDININLEDAIKYGVDCVIL
jgi:hypothetical protein